MQQFPELKIEWAQQLSNQQKRQKKDPFVKFERIMDKKILRAPRVKKIGHTEKRLEMSTGFFNAILDSRKKKTSALAFKREKKVIL